MKMKLIPFFMAMIASSPVLAVNAPKLFGDTPVTMIFQNNTGKPIHIQVDKDSQCWNLDRTDKALINGTTIPVGQSPLYTAWAKNSFGKCSIPGTSILKIHLKRSKDTCNFTDHSGGLNNPGDCAGFKNIDVNSGGDAGNIITIPKQ